MTDIDTSVPKTRSRLSARRLTLLASVAGIGIAVLLGGPGAIPPGHALYGTAGAAESVVQPAGFADVIARVKPAVISVRVSLDEGPQVGFHRGSDEGSSGSPFDRFFRQFGLPGEFGSPGSPQGRHLIGQGSGFFISPDGYAVTNNHVVDHATTVKITTDDEKTYTAKVIGTDPKTDLALIKVDGRSDFPYVKFSDQVPRIGDWALAVGNPFGLSETVTAGIVSARGRDIGSGPYDDFIQIDAPINKGNSGGPTFDVNGNVIGVNTAIYSPSGGSVGIGFAIPADTAKVVVAALKEHGQVTRGYIGVQIQKVSPEIADSLGLRNEAGALVAEPQAGGPAAKAGIEAGDVITAVDGTQLKDAHDLARRIAAMAPGSSVKLTLLRKGGEQTVTVTLGDMPATQEARAGAPEREGSGLGLWLAPAEGVTGSAGVVVTRIDPDGPAAEHGIKTGDVILAVGGKAVSTPGEVRGALGEAREAGKHNVLMQVKSGDRTRFVALPVAHANG